MVLRIEQIDYQNLTRANKSNTIRTACLLTNSRSHPVRALHANRPPSRPVRKGVGGPLTAAAAVGRRITTNRAVCDAKEIRFVRFRRGDNATDVQFPRQISRVIVLGNDFGTAHTHAGQIGFAVFGARVMRVRVTRSFDG